MTHLNPDELIDAMEGLLPADRQEHLTTCEHCRRELADLSIVLSEAKQVSVPEPSPLFWQHFSQRVRIAIDEDVTPEHSWPAWLRWQVLLPLGAVAMIILALMISVPKQDATDSTEFALQTPDASQATDSWAAIEDLVGELDVETASAAGVIEPGVAEQAVLELTADEQQELTRLLKAELTRAKS
jgi:hypothetical protein